MAARIRLSRHGKKKFAFYHIVVTERSFPREGRFIDKIGYYNPNENPPKLEVNSDKALSWLNKGAEPTDTVRTLFSMAGVLLRKHLARGVKLGKITADEAEAKFQKWLSEDHTRRESLRKKNEESASEKRKKGLEAEKKVRAKKSEKILARKLAAEKALEPETPEPVAQTVEAVQNEQAKPEEAVQTETTGSGEGT